MSSVTIVILRISGVGHEIIAVHIIDVSVAIIVDIIGRDLARVCPCVCRQVWMVVGDAGIDNDSDR
jgi:hypothetical protein